MAQERPEINWENLIRTLRHYQANDFTYIEVPWTVPPEITKVTYPKRIEGQNTLWGDIVGSAEQSFIYLADREGLPSGKYCALTPCFRVEKEINRRNRPYFMKVELFQSIRVNEASLHAIIDQAMDWFKQLAPNGNLEIVNTDEGLDIDLNGMEIGSYGIRKYKNIHWIYATALAEPRFSVALACENQLKSTG
jgi:hypothetical protein